MADPVSSSIRRTPVVIGAVVVVLVLVAVTAGVVLYLTRGTGALLDSSTVTLGQNPPTVVLHPGSAAMAYVNPGDCGVTLSATP
jgi:hypothetical protein